MNKSAKLLFIFVFILCAFDTVASDTVGMVKLCRPDDGKSVPSITELLHEKMIFYQNPTGETDDKVAITLPQHALYRNGGARFCVIERVALVGGSASEMFAKKGTTWHANSPYQSAIISMPNGKHVTSTDITENYAITAEAIEDFAQTVTGKIKICRHQGLTEMMDKKSIQIPVSASFTTSGSISEFVVATTESVKLGAKPSCVVSNAEIIENQGSLPVTRKSGRLEAQFVIPGADLEAFVVQDFK